MTAGVIAELLEHSSGIPISPELAERFRVYLELLLRWNERTNLTAVRTQDEIVRRHFGESLQCARALPRDVRSVLDFGSGAGFPGAVCAMARPELAITLTESQGKKAAFLQELCRALKLNATVYTGRVESLPSTSRFDAVTLRAVDRMDRAAAVALERVAPRGWLVLMTTEQAFQETARNLVCLTWTPLIHLQSSDQGILALARKAED